MSPSSSGEGGQRRAGELLLCPETSFVLERLAAAESPPALSRTLHTGVQWGFSPVPS